MQFTEHKLNLGICRSQIRTLVRRRGEKGHEARRRPSMQGDGLNPAASERARGPSVLPRAAVALCVLLLTAASANAQPSGLNNIPTADTPPDRTLVLQGFTNFGTGREPDFFSGFKFGLQPDERIGLEFGLLGRMAPEGTENITFHTKVGLSPAEGWPRLGVGVANISPNDANRDNAGPVFPYLVLSHDFSEFRLHAGYEFQEDNHGGFVGIDRAFDILDRDVTIRADLIQIDDESDWLGSVGTLIPLTDSLVFEGWVSQPFDHGDATVTMKLNVVFRF